MKVLVSKEIYGIKGKKKGKNTWNDVHKLLTLKKYKKKAVRYPWS